MNSFRFSLLCLYIVIVMLIVVILSAIILVCRYTQRHYAKCRYTECRGTLKCQSFIHCFQTPVFENYIKFLLLAISK